MRIYTFLLSHMTDEYRFQLTAKLCQVIAHESYGEKLRFNQKKVKDH